MSLYGNITNMSRSHFQFDKIYPNRYIMEQNLVTDEVFAGRFVLVEYDIDGEFSESDILIGYKKENDEKIYIDIECTKPYYFASLFPVITPLQENWQQYYLKYGTKYPLYFKLPSEEYFNIEENNYYKIHNDYPTELIPYIVTKDQIIRIKNADGTFSSLYYKCINVDTQSSQADIAIWEQIYIEQTESEYFKNYNIDKSFYGESVNYGPNNRGYDGTVWQKVYSSGVGKYVLIAHLNAMIPTFKFIADAPSTKPSSPYIADSSTDMLYSVHIPTQWGFQIKEAEPNVDSDTGAITYPKSDQQVQKDLELFNADIYMNLGGSNKESQQSYHKNMTHIDNDTINKISIEPTGESGQIYYDLEGNENKKDIMELSISLPVIGNMIDDGYELIYGHNNDNTRPRDIQWYSGDVSKNVKENGSSLLGGKTHDLNTFAGTLNTAHDILGQIIIELNSLPSEDQIASMSKDYLYKYQNNYYRIGEGYNFEIINDFQYNLVEIEESDFQNNKYFIQNGIDDNDNPIYVEAFSYDENENYYLKNINGSRYTPIQLTQFESGQFYYRDGENYYCDNSVNYPLYPDRTYFKNIQTDGPYQFGMEFISNQFYIKEQNGNYKKSLDASPDASTIYYGINSDVVQGGNRFRVFKPNVFYTKDQDANRYYLAETYDPTKQYFVFIFSTIPQYGLDINGNIIQYYEVIDQEEVTDFISIENVNDLFINNRDISNLIDLPDGFTSYNNLVDLGLVNNRSLYTYSLNYYTLRIQEHNANFFFVPGLYYELNNNGDYLKSYNFSNSLTNYYVITSVQQVQHPFYITDKYYYKLSENVYEKALFIRMPTLINDGVEYEYFTKSSLYVYEDKTNQCPYGYEWNDYAPYIPPSITLFTKIPIPKIIQLPVLGENSNSLFGLLLELNKICGTNEEDARNTFSIYGIFNMLKDILYQIKNLKPGNLLFVNDFGQIDSTNITVKQLKEIINNG